MRTTAAVAQKMGRRYATVELSPENTDTYVVPRLAKVVAGADPGGITDDAGWQGGGGFRIWGYPSNRSNPLDFWLFTCTTRTLI